MATSTVAHVGFGFLAMGAWAVFLGLGAMCLGVLAALPFIWPEMKLLVRL